MKISIVTPTFNSAALILRNVNSIITQKHHNFEHIIIDNVSSDETISIIENAYITAGMAEKLKIFSKPDNGITEAFNKGVSRAHGEIVTILCSDDYYLDDNIFTDVVKALNNDQYLFAHGSIYFHNPEFGSNIRHPKHTIESLAPYHHMTMFLKRELYDNFGLFNSDFKWGMDFEHWCRLHKCIPQITERACCISDRPMVYMEGMGDSSVNEVRVVHFERMALKLHGFTQFRYRRAIFMRKTRIHIKRILQPLGLTWLVVWWRRMKWGQNTSVATPPCFPEHPPGQQSSDR